MQSRTAFLCAISLLAVLVGCGGGGSSKPTADFTLAIAPSALTITSGGAAQAITVAASAVNGFTGNVNVSVGALPSGVTATPMTLSMTPGGLQQINVIAGPAAVAGSASISIQ